MRSKKLLSILILSLLTVISSATIINIPADYSTIQAGIDASSDGDTVLVHPGIYSGGINLNAHKIVLASLFLTTTDSYYIDSTLIDGENDIQGITVDSGQDSTTLIVGFTIQNCAGYGIYLGENSNPIISNNRILNNNGTNSSGAITCVLSNPLIRENTFSNNSSPHSGGAIHCTESSPTIYKNFISDNSASFNGAGIYCNMESNPFIEENIITGNNTNQYGGAIFVNSNSKPMIIRNTISNNSATWGGAIGFRSGAGGKVAYNIISENDAGIGGGIYENGSTPTIDDNIISDNTANSGAGIYCREGAPIITYNTITGNISEHYYAGIYCGLVDSGSQVDYNEIRDNITGYSGGGIGLSGYSRITVKENIITGNYAGTNGGGISCAEGATGELKYNLITNNSCASNGGGIFCSATTILLELMNNTIAFNSSEENGGGVYCTDDARMIITNTIIWGNNSELGSHSIFVNQSYPDFEYCDIQGGWEGESNLDCDPSFCDSYAQDFRLLESSCCVGTGEDGSNIGAIGIGCDEHRYLPGDCNMAVGQWPPQIIGGDVTYLVGYFRGITSACNRGGFYAPADVNGDCLVIGADVTYLISYFRGYGTINWCPDFPPLWLSTDECPVDEPSGWPNCEE